MIPTGKQPVRSRTRFLVHDVGLVTGGGAASNATITSGLRGVSSVTYASSTGLYWVNYAVVPAGTFLGAKGSGSNSTPAAADSFVVCHVNGSYDATNKRFKIQVIDLGATPTLADLATTEQIILEIFWAETAKI